MIMNINITIIFTSCFLLLKLIHVQVHIKNDPFLEEDLSDEYKKEKVSMWVVLGFAWFDIDYSSISL